MGRAMQQARYMSLREVGRRLNIPPSTVVYYKDKFEKFIPSSGGGGRRRRYPIEALEIFRRIREMFGSNWTVEQIENELALKFSTLIRNEQNDQQLNDVAVGASSIGMEQILARISDALDDQGLFRSEIRSLRDELSGLREGYISLKEEVVGRVGLLEEQLKVAQAANERLERMVRGQESGGGIAFPDSEYLERPLVIRSNGEYLGVQGTGAKHFSLKDFVALIELRASSVRGVDTSWQYKSGNWVLVVKMDDAEKQLHQDVVLVTAKTVTPSGNTVTEIVRLNIDGVDAPDSLLLGLFRQVRTVFGG